MARDKFKDLTISGINFRIGLLSALDGDWLITQMLTRRFADAEVYRKAQTYLLGACSVYVEKDGSQIPMKIFDGGRWLVLAQFPDLEYDADTVHQLIDAALEFNVGPFFERWKAQLSDPTPATSQ